MGSPPVLTLQNAMVVSSRTIGTSVPARWLPISNFTPLTLIPPLTATWRVFSEGSAAATGDW